MNHKEDKLFEIVKDLENLIHLVDMVRNDPKAFLNRQNKIRASIRWVHNNLDVNQVINFIEENEYNFDMAYIQVILKLLNNPEFNPKLYN